MCISGPEANKLTNVHNQTDRGDKSVILMSESVQSLSVTVAAVSLSLSCVYSVAEGETLEEVVRLASVLIRSC